MKANIFIWVNHTLLCVPFFIADLVPRCHSLVWGWSDRTPSWHNTHVCPGCAWVWDQAQRPCVITRLNAPIIIHSSTWKKAGLRTLRYFPSAKQKCLACQIRDIRGSDFPARCTPLLREWEDSLVFTPPGKTGCLLGWQIARISGFDPETDEIKTEKNKVTWSHGLLGLLIL